MVALVSSEDTLYLKFQFPLNGAPFICVGGRRKASLEVGIKAKRAETKEIVVGPLIPI